MLLQQSSNDREAEFETDKTALELVSFAGYDPTEYEKFLTSLGEEKNGLTAQHPKTGDRVAKLKALREGELKDFVHGTAKPDLGKVFAPLSE
jgi:predicted Zn-dependent protease